MDGQITPCRRSFSQCKRIAGVDRPPRPADGLAAGAAAGWRARRAEVKGFGPVRGATRRGRAGRVQPAGADRNLDDGLFVRERESDTQHCPDTDAITGEGRRHWRSRPTGR